MTTGTTLARDNAPTNSIIALFRSNIRQYSMLIALIAIMVFFQIVTDGTLMKPVNLTNLILQNSYIVIMAIGMLLVIVAGQIDLSVGSVAAFVGAVAAVLMVEYKVNFILVIIASLALGGLIGAAQGYWIAYQRIPSFIATLAGMLVFRGLTLAMLQGQSVGPFPTGFQKLSSGFLPDVFGSETLHVTSLIIGVVVSLVIVYLDWNGRRNQVKYGFEVSPFGLFLAKNILVMAVIIYMSYLMASYKGLPNVLVVLFILIVAYAFFTNQTVSGRRIYALGGNAKAAALSGVNTKKLTFLTFVNMGMLAALGGLIIAARLNVATPKAGTGIELDVIAAAFIGGASATGGIGTVIGAVVGALVMGVMNNGMSIVGIGIDWQQAIKGLVLLLAVWFDVRSRMKS
ncbi:MAG: sugar ABC transporter permease [Anaerolineales bacterium]|nr:sugar ABC transporter permease [Anaerolineales bacterium]MCA9974125.1 sugar ABC transporter permease [Anaerolineales bacterium]MCB8965744.1 sugar ABC transporter permease [Ardenticatenaceae bacterium]